MVCCVKRGVLAGLMAWCCGVATAQSTPAPVFACVSEARLACGCAIRLAVPVCANRVFPAQPHLFTELDPAAPLHLVVDGQELALPLVAHRGEPIKGDPPGGPWTDIYRSAKGEVQLDYEPGRSTCTKPAGESCEYTDVAVQVRLILPGRAPLQVRGTGTCGC